VPTIAPASHTAPDKFESGLQEPSRPLFRRLARLIEACGPHDLLWYHKLGTLTRKLRDAERPGSASASWVTALGRAIGPSDSALTKACRFVDLYPDSAAVRPLAELKIDWVRLVLTFVVKSADERLRVLRAAVEGRWTQDELRLRVQAKTGTGRRGVGAGSAARPSGLTRMGRCGGSGAWRRTWPRSTGRCSSR
jgi:hypothetical protein